MSPAPQRPCLTCGTPTTRTRCPNCTSRHRSPARRHRSTAAWTNTSRQILQAWRARHGDWCPGWPPTRHQPHPTTDLTVHHLDQLAANNGNDTNRYAVLCRSENSRIG